MVLIADRTRRVFKPNVQNQSFWSDILQKKLKFTVTTYAMRCIDKAGGIDNYLLNTRDDKLASELGVQLKRRLAKLVGKRSLASATESPAAGVITRAGLASAVTPASA